MWKSLLYLTYGMLVGLAVVFVAAILIGMAYTNNKKEE